MQQVWVGLRFVVRNLAAGVMLRICSSSVFGYEEVVICDTAPGHYIVLNLSMPARLKWLTQAGRELRKCPAALRCF